MIKMDKGVPIPKRRKSKYPILDMFVGDSFAVPVPEGRNPRRVQSSINTACNKIKTDGEKFTTRSLVEDGERVIRCWRVE